MLCRTRRHELPIGGHYLRREQIVGDQTKRAHQRTIPPTQREADQPDAGDGPGSRRQTVVLRGIDQVARHSAALDTGCTRRRIDGDGMHWRTVDYDPIRAQGASHKIVSPTSHGERQPMRPRPAYGMHHVLGRRAANDHGWTGVYSAVPELAHLLIGGILGEDKLASKACCEIRERRPPIALCGYHQFFLWVLLYEPLCASSSDPHVPLSSARRRLFYAWPRRARYMPAMGSP
jgi:hypothetical protein